MRHGCSGCAVTWTQMGVAHCPSCHGTFADVTLFDRHRRHGACLDPSTLLDTAGQRVMFWSGGSWRPVATELAAKGRRRTPCA